MRDPDFLTLDDLLALHADRVERYGGSSGFRDAAGLSAAMGMASATFGGAFLHPTLAEMAAAYLFHVSQAHGFVDGNKRAALAAALAFLSLHGYGLDADPGQEAEREQPSGGAAADVGYPEGVQRGGRLKRPSARPADAPPPGPPRGSTSSGRPHGRGVTTPEKDARAKADRVDEDGAHRPATRERDSE